MFVSSSGGVSETRPCSRGSCLAPWGLEPEGWGQQGDPCGGLVASGLHGPLDGKGDGRGARALWLVRGLALGTQSRTPVLGVPQIKNPRW